MPPLTELGQTQFHRNCWAAKLVVFEDFGHFQGFLKGFDTFASRLDRFAWQSDAFASGLNTSAKGFYPFALRLDASASAFSPFASGFDGFARVFYPSA
jgi:hypothetical protein